jgi:transposase InsO family protein
VNEPDCVYCGDITYIWTSKGWLYLAVVLDLFSRQVVGWSMSNRITKQLVMDALNMAIWRRRPASGDIVDYIEMFYNSKRRHSYLGYLSPREFEKMMALKKAA